MAVAGLGAEGDVQSWQRRLQKPQSGIVCLCSWILATAIFMGLVAILGGPTQNDAVESFYAAWAIGHGSLSCAYPPASPVTASFPLFYHPGVGTAPLWPLISGGLAWLTRIGHTVAFPSLGVNCVNAYAGMFHWARTSYAVFPTIGLAYASWFVLLAGVVALLRASGRGRSGWEVIGVVFVALVPIVWMPVLDQFHPQDLVAMGLALAGVACVERRSWVWAGVLLGLAVTSQQVALLVVVPIVVVVPRTARWWLLLSAAGAFLLVSLPLVIATSGRALSAAVLGTGDHANFGSTVVGELRLHGPSLVFGSRVLPILIALVIAWWALRRLGSWVLEPVPLIALVATSLSLRLVFEQLLFGYYFVALAVMLIMLDIVRGRIRGQLVAWLALVTLAFQPVPTGLAVNARSWGDHLASALPLACVAIALALIARDAAHHRVRWYLVAFFVIAACAFLQWPLWSPDSLRAPLPEWLWQLLLVPAGIVMALGPLVRSIGAQLPPTSLPEVETIPRRAG